MSKVYNKLVRDKIPEIIKNNKENPITRILENEEYFKELLKKLDEECIEVKNTSNKEELLEETADVLEVLISLIKTKGYTLEDLLDVRNKKKEKRGGFENKIFLEKVE